jgi:hypothetical protein
MNGRAHTKDQEREVVKQLLADYTTPKEGECRYILSGKWWKAWKKYVGYEYFVYGYDTKPGPINNKDLFDEKEPDSLKPGLVDTFDYEVCCSMFCAQVVNYLLTVQCMPEDVWTYLKQWCERNVMYAHLVGGCIHPFF